MKRTYFISDFVLIAFSLLICAGGINLGLGALDQPQAGFMPFFSGLLLGLLSLVDVISGLRGRWDCKSFEKDIWAEINWLRLTLILGVLFVYSALFNTMGFITGTVLLFLFLFRIAGMRPWWKISITSSITTALFYLIFKIGLDSQLPSGFLGF